jgi:phosphomannomutase/phosphomannomutase/phosphoglucomutase
MMDPVIFREYDIRGVYGEHFDDAFAGLLAQGYATFLDQKLGPGKKTVTVGYDARLSSPSLAKALVAGFTRSGVDVLELGQITTPMSYYSTFAIPQVCGAIMITGSHNPPDYNGFKISCGKTTIHGQDIQHLKQILINKEFKTGAGTASKYDIFPSYVARYKEEFRHLKPLKIVLDCGNGAAGVVARSLFKDALGLNAEILFEQPDGRFPNHHPDPTIPENLKDLIAAVKKSGAVAGIGFDGDADRIGLVGGNGEVIPGDQMLALLSRFILSKNPGQSIIADVKCSDRLFDDIRKHNGKPIMWKSGHSLIKEKIKDEKSPFGGELSGHIFFADRNYGYDDALYAGLRVLEILSETGKSISELMADLPHAFSTPEIRIDTTEQKKHAIVQALKKQFSDTHSKDYSTNLIDGIRVSFKNGWALARASNTQPVLVLRFEATTADGLSDIRRQFERIVEPLL